VKQFFMPLVFTTLMKQLCSLTLMAKGDKDSTSTSKSRWKRMPYSTYKRKQCGGEMPYSVFRYVDMKQYQNILLQVYQIHGE
jgi:hypothetical protein